MEDYSKIAYSDKEGVAVIRLNSPETMNALEETLFNELRHATRRAVLDQSVGAVVLTGTGRAFCAGGDLKRFAQGFSSFEEARDYMSSFATWVKEFRAMPKPTIAAINGYAVGAGFCIALHADLVIASREAKFGMAFAGVGLIPDLGGLSALPEIVGINKAKELVFTGRNIDAAEAEALGIVNKVTSPEELADTAYKLAKSLADGPRVAHRAAKRLINDSRVLTLDELLEQEAELQAECIQTEDHKNAVAAFFKKEKPQFKGC